MLMQTSDLTGPALDWAVAKCEGRGIEFDDPRDPWLTRDGIADQPLHSYTPSTDWSQGGPIIERENISIVRCDDDYQNFPDKWLAERGANSYCESTEHQQHDAMIQFSVWNDGGCFAKDGPFYGPTPLIAAMRCFVASRLGDEVDVPDELA